jgi:predicted Zn-dependent protease
MGKRLICLFSSAGILLFLLSCTTTPITHRSQVMLVSEPDEIRLGLTAYRSVLSKAKISNDAEAVARVRRVGRRVATAANRPDYAWEFTLIHDPAMVNAFALPGGKLAVYSGILPVTQTDAGLAAVLSHEVAHAIARHGGERMSRGLLVQVGMTALNVGLAAQGQSPGAIEAFNQAYGIGAALGVVLPFSRDQESEADRMGLTLMSRAGFDPKEAIAFWQRMAVVKKNQVPEFLATHPSDERRIAQIGQWLPEAQKAYRPHRE